jgi:hypothetical protein
MMKKLSLLILIPALLVFGCKKDSTNKSSSTLGSVFKIQTSSTGTYLVTLNEYSSNGQTTVFSKDTTITNSSFNYQWQPTIGDQVSFIIAWGGSNPTPTYSSYYGSTLETNYQSSTAGSAPFNDYSSLSFTVN